MFVRTWRVEWCGLQVLVWQAMLHMHIAHCFEEAQIFHCILCKPADNVEQQQRNVITHYSLVVRSVIAEVCQRCCKIPCVDSLDASRLHDILRKGIVKQYGGVCPPVCVKPMLVLAKRIGGCCHLQDRKIKLIGAPIEQA